MANTTTTGQHRRTIVHDSSEVGVCGSVGNLGEDRLPNSERARAEGLNSRHRSGDEDGDAGVQKRLHVTFDAQGGWLYG